MNHETLIGDFGGQIQKLQAENAALKEQVAQLQEQVDLQIPKQAFAELQSKSAALVDALIKEHGNYVGKASVGIGCSVCDLIDAALAAFKGEK
jgi:hypothetical protein